MRKRILQVIIAVGLLSPLVFGDSKTFTWSPPVGREDGTFLLDQEIKEYELHCNSGLEVIINNDGFTNTWVSADTDFPPGFYTCWMHAVDIDDQHSPDSDPADFSVFMEFEVVPTPSTQSKGSGCT